MYTVLIILIVVAAILLGLVVLMQNSKGGGLSSTFSSSSQIMGVRKTADFLEKATWVLSIAIVVLCFVSNFFASSVEKQVEQQGSRAAGAQTMTNMPIQTPAATSTPAAEAPISTETGAEGNTE
ncbi:MAG: preprotein translocase subunit SecG [Bacteroidales bacterium]|jgi:preprotein translocase subunit SecG|nr:preprotein translocase subunit SecG [Bacteroidales bacterium]